MNTKHQQFFTQTLSAWHDRDNQRSYPWKQEKDPYKIWLSEIILQQTRSEQGLPYYLNYIQAFPTIKDLAEAPEERVYKLWQGLGYYNRCKNMLVAARTIMNEHNGIFPNSYEAILQLKGIGSYTAAAIASFAFHLPYAVLDGNVYRVLARFFDIDTPIDTGKGKKEFEQLAQILLDKNNPAKHNQAIMDFGASICTPKNTQCDICPLASKCLAFKHNTVALLPIKEKKLKIKTRYFHYLQLEYKGKYYVQQRTGNDIWQNLYEFYLIEKADANDIANDLEMWAEYSTSTKIIGEIQQKLTHQIINFKFYKLILSKIPKFISESHFISSEAMHQKAFPKAIAAQLDF